MPRDQSQASSAPDRRSDRASGFTLLELLVVLAILGLLAAIAVPPLMHYLGQSKTQTARLQVQALSQALDLFRLDVGRYPTQQEGLQSLVVKPSDTDTWDGPYVKKQESLVDPWGFLYHYRIPGEHGEYDLYSLGADNAEGGTGENQDVTNW